MAITAIASAASSTLLLEYNPVRKGLIVTNTDANRLYVLLDSGTASATNYSFYLDTGGVFGVEDYTGDVKGIWGADGAGSAILTHWN